MKRNENKTRKPYEKPSMTVFEVEPMSILAGSGTTNAPDIDGGMWDTSLEDEEIKSY